MIEINIPLKLPKVGDMKPSQWIERSIEVKQGLLDPDVLRRIQRVIETVTQALHLGQRVFFCGNGGSAADAQHLAAELSVRYKKGRRAYAGIALGSNFSHLTAAANDFGYEHVFSRQIEAEGRSGDILIAMSTSGNSDNILRAIGTANKLGMVTIGWSGKTGGKMASLCQILLCVPSQEVARIQECHMLIGHILCEYIDEIP